MCVDPKHTFLPRRGRGLTSSAAAVAQLNIVERALDPKHPEISASVGADALRVLGACDAARPCGTAAAR